MDTILQIFSFTLSNTYKIVLRFLNYLAKSTFYSIRFGFRGLTRDLAIAFFAIIFTLIFIPFFTYVYFANALITKDRIMNNNDTGLVLLDRKNRPFFSFYQAKTRDNVGLDKISPFAQKAVIAMEDKDFYQHGGFSVPSIFRSLIADIKGGDLAYGGSTLTQQLVKNSLLSSRKDFLRKYQEIILAEEIERHYSKDEILSMYLNSVYFGRGSFGIEQASQNYFGKHAADLSLAQSAMLAGLLPAPTQFSDDFNQGKMRQKLVLEKMQQQGYVSQDQISQAEKEKIVFVDNQENMNSVGIHFALMVKNQLVQKYSEETVARSGFKVHTGLDLDWQKYAETVVVNQVKNLTSNSVSNGAAIVEDPSTGEIRALVGSVDWHDNKFGKVNMAEALRQPGSSFKPIVYLKAFEDRIISPSTILHDVPTAFRNIADPTLAASWRVSDPNAYYKPLDYDGKFRGNVLPRRALSNSLNIPAVEVMSKVGVPSALEMAHRLGITTLDDPSRFGLSLVLGAGEVKLLEMTNVYATFANRGNFNPPTLVTRIDDKYNSTIYKYQPNPQSVVDPKDTFIITSILSDNWARQEEFGNTLTISRPAAVKTGTTENYKDAWTLGYTPTLAVGTWVGNNDGAVMDNVAGSLGAAPIWKQLMEHFLAGTPVQNFTPPEGMVKLAICPNGQKLREASSSAYIEYFVPGTEPTGYCASATPSASPQPQPTDKNKDNKVKETYNPSTNTYAVYIP